MFLFTILYLSKEDGNCARWIWLQYYRRIKVYLLSLFTFYLNIHYIDNQQFNIHKLAHETFYFGVSISGRISFSLCIVLVSNSWIKKNWTSNILNWNWKGVENKQQLLWKYAQEISM